MILDKSIRIGKILGFNNRQNESGVSKVKLFAMEMNEALCLMICGRLSEECC